MRKSFLLAVALTVFAIAVMAATAPVNFAGTWLLDKEKSQGLSPRLQGADSVTWVITQDDKTISIDQKVAGGQPPAGGGPGGGGGGGGRGPTGPTSYGLDGKETTMDITGQMTGKSTLKATWAASTLELSRKSVLNGPNGEVNASDSRKLTLSSDGKVLTAVTHSEGPRGAMDSTLVFNKQ